MTPVFTDADRQVILRLRAGLYAKTEEQSLDNALEEIDALRAEVARLQREVARARFARPA